MVLLIKKVKFVKIKKCRSVYSRSLAELVDLDMVPRVLELRERLEQAEIRRAIAEARAAELAAVVAELAPAVAAAAA